MSLGGIGRGRLRQLDAIEALTGSRELQPGAHPTNLPAPQQPPVAPPLPFGRGRGSIGSDGFSLELGDKQSGFGSASKPPPPLGSTDAAAKDDERQPVTYVPPELADDELFSPDYRIGVGEHFERFFGAADPVEVRCSGHDAADRCIDSFDDAGLHPRVLENVRLCGYTRPMPIQARAIPLILAGRDLMGCAQTGSGKTAAFMAPIVSWVASHRQAGVVNSDAPYAIVLAPSRELSSQINREGRRLALGTGVRLAEAYGQTAVRESVAALRRGCDVLTATAGRLEHFVGNGTLLLGRVKFVVLDEADRMLENGGFGSFVRDLTQHADMPPKGTRQMLMFSATLNADVQQLATEFLHEHTFINVNRVSAANVDVKQVVVQVDKFEKRDKLLDLVRETTAGLSAEEQKKHKTLVFVAQKRMADMVAALLLQDGIGATSMHGDRTQELRELALSELRRGDCGVLVATDVAARGLDVAGVAHVVNYDLPAEIDVYVHRIGRTGRVGNVGTATSFYDAAYDEPLAAKLVQVLADAQQEVPDFLRAAEPSAADSTALAWGADGF